MSNSRNKILYLLVIRDINVYKIGISVDVAKRIKTLQTGCPYKIEVLKVYNSEIASKIEKILHRQYSAKKIDYNEYNLKGEWFNLDINLVVDFIKICSKIENDLVLLTKMNNPFLKI